MRKFLIVLASLAFVFGGCRDEDGNNNNVKYDIGGGGSALGTTPKDGTTGPCTETTLCKIKGGAVTDGTCVTIKDAIVSAVDTNGTYTKDVFIQATEGTKTCGIKLYQATRADSKIVTQIRQKVKAGETVIGYLS